jgi:hypothetical protein
MENEILENENDNDEYSFNIIIDDYWAIGADPHQWIIKRKVSSKSKDVWVGKSFIASTKQHLLKNLKEKGAIITPDVQIKLDELPDSFAEFKYKYKIRSKKGRKKTIINTND